MCSSVVKFRTQKTPLSDQFWKVFLDYRTTVRWVVICVIVKKKIQIFSFSRLLVILVTTKT